MARTTNYGSNTREDESEWYNEFSTSLVIRKDDAGWRVTQDGLDLVGRGPNLGRAVQHFGELYAETVCEREDAPDARRSLLTGNGSLDR